MRHLGEEFIGSLRPPIIGFLGDTFIRLAIGLNVNDAPTFGITLCPMTIRSLGLCPATNRANTRTVASISSHSNHLPCFNKCGGACQRAFYSTLPG